MDNPFQRVLHSFGFTLLLDSLPESIYPYAPVFRVRDERGEWIVKRAQKPLERARAVASWTRALAADGVPVVTPADGFGENPRALELANLSEQGKEETSKDEQAWVVYPFISGRPYSGSLTEIRSAGELLGRLHAFQPEWDFGLKVSRTVVAVDEDEIAADIAGILGFVGRFFPQKLEAARSILMERTGRYSKTALPRMLELELPLANCTWDYKASNLVYEKGVLAEEAQLAGEASLSRSPLPVLTDPDNAGRIPRLYDLAIAGLLFHNDGIGPGRLFDRAEWQAFRQGYSRHIALTAEERGAWDDLLLCAWVDEGLWLLNGEEADWAHPIQGKMQLSLLTADLSIFELE